MLALKPSLMEYFIVLLSLMESNIVRAKGKKCCCPWVVLLVVTDSLQIQKVLPSQPPCGISLVVVLMMRDLLTMLLLMVLIMIWKTITKLVLLHLGTSLENCMRMILPRHTTFLLLLNVLTQMLLWEMCFLRSILTFPSSSSTTITVV